MSLMDQKMASQKHRLFSPASHTYHINGLSSFDSELRDSLPLNTFTWYMISLHPGISLHCSNHSLQLYILCDYQFLFTYFMKVLTMAITCSVIQVLSSNWHTVIQIYVQWINEHMNGWMNKWNITKILIYSIKPWFNMLNLVIT